MNIITNFNKNMFDKGLEAIEKSYQLFFDAHNSDCSPFQSLGEKSQ